MLHPIVKRYSVLKALSMGTMRKIMSIAIGYWTLGVAQQYQNLATLLWDTHEGYAGIILIWNSIVISYI